MVTGAATALVTVGLAVLYGLYMRSFSPECSVDQSSGMVVCRWRREWITHTNVTGVVAHVHLLYPQIVECCEQWPYEAVCADNATDWSTLVAVLRVDPTRSVTGFRNGVSVDRLKLVLNLATSLADYCQRAQCSLRVRGCDNQTQQILAKLHSIRHRLCFLEHGPLDTTHAEMYERFGGFVSVDAKVEPPC